MRKPDFHWETARSIARRLAEPTRLRGEPRAEAFRLEDRRGEAAPFEVEFSLRRQVVPAAALDRDPGLLHAAQCWLGARGVREFALESDAGERLAAGSFKVGELGLSGPAGEPRRLVSLAPSNAEILAALGGFDRVIACEDSTDFPPEAAACERLGPDLGPDLDRIAALAPDLALASLSVPGMERVVTGLRARGVPHLVLAPRSLGEVLAEIRAVGERLQATATAARVIAGMEAERAALRAARPARPVRVYLEWWPRPMFTPGRECYSNELIALAGGVNVFGGRPGSSLEVSPAELCDADPEVCFVSWCGVAAAKLDPENLIGRAGLEALSAARRRRVYPVDEAFSGRPGPRMLEAARIMAAAIREAAADPG
ncbi:MAG: helical backbone metal receptor [Nannocystaceae bacterium]